MRSVELHRSVVPRFEWRSVTGVLLGDQVFRGRKLSVPVPAPGEEAVAHHIVGLGGDHVRPNVRKAAVDLEPRDAVAGAIEIVDVEAQPGGVRVRARRAFGVGGVGKGLLEHGLDLGARHLPR